MNHLFDKVFADTRAEDARKAGIYPYFHRLESRQDAVVVMEGKRRIMLGSNNYLGLTACPEVMEAAVKAVETVDTCVGRFVEAIREVGGVVCITADHGNADQMVDPVSGAPFTAHTTNPVPFIVVADNVGWIASDGALCDIAPTLLTLAGMEIPAEMTGKSMVKLK